MAKPGYSDQGDQPKRGKKQSAKEIVQIKNEGLVSMLVMLPTLVKTPFSNPAWIFEPKWDGFRAVCYIAEGEARFLSRRRNDLTKKFPPLQSIATSIKADSAVLDGEIVALDKKGPPHFGGLRASRSAEFTIVYFTFDLMYLNGESLTQLPLTESQFETDRF